MNVPQLRFDGFIGEWEEVALNELGSFMKGMALSKADISKDGEPCILYGELYTRYGPVIQKVFSKTDSQIEKKVFGIINDVLIPSSGETAIDIACASALEVEKVLLGGDLSLFRPNKQVNGSFLSYQINGIRKFELSKLAQGASVVHLYSNSLKKFRVSLPSFEEQQKIASFFKSLDKKIDKQKESIEKLEQFKKGMTQKVFSQELRFKDEDGEDFPEWKKDALQEIVKEFIVPMRDKPKDFGGNIPWCRIEDREEKYMNGSLSGQGVSIDTIKKMNLKIIPENSVLCSCSARVGICSITTVPLITNQTFIGLVPNSSTTTDFLYYLMSSLSRRLESLSSGTTISYISRNAFEKLKVSCPVKEEQIKIATFLSKIDIKLHCEKEKLMILKEQKKGFMQGMFV